MEVKSTLLLILTMLMINALKCVLQKYERDHIKGNVTEATEFSYEITVKDKILSNVVNNAVIITELNEEGINYATRDKNVANINKKSEVILTHNFTEFINKTNNSKPVLNQLSSINFTKQKTEQNDGKDSEVKLQDLKGLDGEKEIVTDRTPPLEYKNKDSVTDRTPISSECKRKNQDIVTDRTPPLEYKHKNQDCTTDKTPPLFSGCKNKKDYVVTDRTPPLEYEHKAQDIVTDRTPPLEYKHKNQDCTTDKTPPLSSGCKNMNEDTVTDRTPPLEYKENDQDCVTDETPLFSEWNPKNEECVTDRTPPLLKNEHKANKSHLFANVQKLPSFLIQLFEYKLHFLEKLGWVSTNYFAEKEKFVHVLPNITPPDEL